MWRPITSPATTLAPRPSEAAAPAGLPRVELSLDRLGAKFRFTYAFHARELRFELDAGSGYERIFAETFSFHADRHDPAELHLQLEDLWTNPRLLGPRANRRDAEGLVRRFLLALPGCLEDALVRFDDADGIETRVLEDVSIVAHVVGRFLGDKGGDDHVQFRRVGWHMRRLAFTTLRTVARRRVSQDFREQYLAGEAELDTSREFGAYYALAGGNPSEIDRTVMGAAERAFYGWLEQVCLDQENQAFETEDSPFDERAEEVLKAVAADGAGPIDTERDFVIFLRRPENRDCRRVLDRLRTWFLRQYDVHHGAVVLHHAANLDSGDRDPDRRLSWHSRSVYLLVLTIPLVPFLLAALGAGRVLGPALDWVVTIDVAAILVISGTVLLYRFLWQRDLTFFHAAVPRVTAGIIVGYLPVFLIDEVWDLAGQPVSTLATVVVMLGMPTLLYIYAEVESRLGNREIAWRRAVDVFLLGLMQSSTMGLVVTSLLGGLMTSRNWGEDAWREQVGEVTLVGLRDHLGPVIGHLPPIMGVEPLPAFPTAILLMSVLAFFIGTFLQLLWEDLPITEPV